MDNVYSQIFNILTSGRRVVLASIIRQSGSAPRPLGTSCLILEDGSLVGTIGGGALEYRVLQQAVDVFRKSKTALLHFNLTGPEVASTDMLCGGIVDVYLEPLNHEDQTAKDIFRKAAEMVDNRRPGALLTRIEEGLVATDPTSRVLITENDLPEGLPRSLLDMARQVQDRLRQTKHPKLESLPSGEPAFFIQPIRTEDALYIFGAGHVSACIAPLAKSVGFRVAVIDDRAEFANRDRFPSADEIIVTPFSQAFGRFGATDSAYIVIVTRGHSHDRDLLFQALQKKWAYVGMIGSRRKKEIIYESLRQAGISEGELQQVHSPIGLDIGADTPEEIAVSIVAELIQVRVTVAAP